MIIDSQYAVLNRLNNERKNNKTIVFTNGCYDIIHLGHIRGLEAAKKLGDFLVVAVNDDVSVRSLKGDNRPFNVVSDRIEFLKSLRCVDAVIGFSTIRCDDAIRYCKPDVYTKSSDYSLNNMDKGELSALQKIGAEIIFTPFLKGYSTSEILKLNTN